MGKELKDMIEADLSGQGESPNVAYDAAVEAVDRANEASDKVMQTYELRLAKERQGF